jgi:cytochrome c-type biogenesis protein CcmH/NrfF
VGNLWALATLVGPILLGAILLWALLRNRKRETPEEVARTEAATHRLYEEEDREDHERDVQR